MTEANAKIRSEDGKVIMNMNHVNLEIEPWAAKKMARKLRFEALEAEKKECTP